MDNYVASCLKDYAFVTGPIGREMLIGLGEGMEKEWSGIILTLAELHKEHRPLMGKQNLNPKSRYTCKTHPKAFTPLVLIVWVTRLITFAVATLNSGQKNVCALHKSTKHLSVLLWC